ncbi:MAG: hypothetical protein L0H70_07195, partial [Xanthomonadales bacterium]|nr:hypothetical protein [Xanthomonadales bacterium]
DRADAGPATLLMNFYNPQCLSDAQACFYRDQDYTRAHINLMRPDLEGRQYFGLPAIGFAATDWINDRAAGPGVLANYSFVSSYKRTRVCLQDGVVGGCH